MEKNDLKIGFTDLIIWTKQNTQEDPKYRDAKKKIVENLDQYKEIFFEKTEIREEIENSKNMNTTEIEEINMDSISNRELERMFKFIEKRIEETGKDNFRANENLIFYRIWIVIEIIKYLKILKMRLIRLSWRRVQFSKMQTRLIA